jgi:hypothetical protein
MQDENLRNELLAEVDSIAPILAEHAPLSETLGRQDTPSMEAVRSTRLVRMFCPRELGGIECPLGSPGAIASRTRSQSLPGHGSR